MSAARTLLSTRRAGLAAELEAVDRALAELPAEEPVAAPPSPASNDDDAWDVDRAAKFLGVSTSWLYKASAAGDVPHVKNGGRLTFDPGDLREYRAKNRRGTTMKARVMRRAGDPK